jgi:hypothetical protein
MNNQQWTTSRQESFGFRRLWIECGSLQADPAILCPNVKIRLTAERRGRPNPSHAAQCNGVPAQSAWRQPWRVFYSDMLWKSTRSCGESMAGRCDSKTIIYCIISNLHWAYEGRSRLHRRTDCLNSAHSGDYPGSGHTHQRRSLGDRRRERHFSLFDD